MKVAVRWYGESGASITPDFGSEGNVWLSIYEPGAGVEEGVYMFKNAAAAMACGHRLLVAAQAAEGLAAAGKAPGGKGHGGAQ